MNTRANDNRAALDDQTTTASTLSAEGSLAPGFADFSSPRRIVQLPPQTVLNGRYAVQRVIGEGGMGLVYEVQDALNPDRRVALKTIDSTILSQKRVSLFKSEFKTMASLRHPHIAAVYDFESRQGSADWFFTMEYIDGCDLMRATEGSSIDRIVALTIEICRALSYLHSRKVIHFDLKPANILVDRDGHVRVLDFGVAGGGGPGSPLVGTPAYMAPELLADSAVDHRSDLYSFGIVLYQLICRRVPFAASSVALVMHKHANEALGFDADVKARTPGWLLAVVERLCAKIPAERYRSANAVIEDVNARGGTAFELETVDTKESYILSSRFVGRDKEREHILDFVWQRTRSPNTRSLAVVMVCGTSGVGKSRLVREAKQQIQLAGLPFIETSCYEGDYAELGPIAALSEQVVRLARSVKAEDLITTHASALHTINPRLGQGVTAERSVQGKNEVDRLAMIEQLSAFFVAVADRTPFVLYLNDMQWARPGTADVLRSIVRRVAQRTEQKIPLAVIGSYRADEVEGRPIEKLLASLSGAEIATIALKPLDAAHVERLLGSMLGVDRLPPEFVDRVATETAGVPFFVEEVMRSLVDRGAVYLEQGVWAASSAIGELEIPASIASVFRRRMSLLDDEARSVFDLMATYGRPISADILEACAAGTGEAVYASLRTLSDRQMAVRLSGAEPRYRIGHDRMRETAYGDLSEEKKQGLHQRIAMVLEARLETDDELTYEIAHHYWRSPDRAKALHYGILAGERAQAAYANDLAIEHLRRVLALLDPSAANDDVRARISEKLADVEHLTADYQDALRRYRALLEAAGDAPSKARLLRKICAVYSQAGGFLPAVEAGWQAVELLGHRKPRGSIAIVWQTLTALATHLVHRFLFVPKATTPEERARQRELSSMYRALAEVSVFADERVMPLCVLASSNAGERAGECRERCRAHANISYAYTLFGSKTAHAYADRAWESAERLNLSLELGVALVFRGMVALNLGQIHGVLPWLERGKKLLAKHGDVLAWTIAETNIGNLLTAQGKLREAAASADEVVRLVERTGSLSYGKTVIASAGYYRGLLGEAVAAKERLDQALRMAEEAKDRPNILSVLVFRGHLEYVRGELAMADETLAAARERARGSTFYLVGLMLPISALTKLLLSPSADRKALVREVLPLVKRGLAFTRRRGQFRACALLAEAAFLWRIGKRSKALRRFAACRELAEAQGHLFALADTNLMLGRLLLESGETRQAGPYLERAVDAYERFGVLPALELARQLSRGTQQAVLVR